jgi:hypothetical protein
MNTEALAQIVRVLKATPPEAVNLFDWVSDCGTAACAIGHAAQDPWFNERGLRLTHITSEPQFNGTNGWGAVQQFLRLTDRAAQILFYESSYTEPTPQAVIQRITDFIETPYSYTHDTLRQLHGNSGVQHLIEQGKLIATSKGRYKYLQS